MVKNLHNNAGSVAWILQGQVGYARKTKIYVFSAIEYYSRFTL